MMLCTALGRRLRWALSSLAILALLATSLGSIVTPTFAAWNPAHGHLSDSEVASDHTHPWDDVETARPDAFDPDDYCSLHGALHPIAPIATSEEPAPTDDEPSIVFTMGADGTVASIGSPALPAVDSTATQAPALIASVHNAQTTEPASAALRIPVPPPRI